MSTSNGKTSSSSTFSLLKKSRQKAPTSLSGRLPKPSTSKTPKRLNDIQPTNEVGKMYPGTSSSAQKPMEVTNSLGRPFSTKSHLSNHKDQFDRYFKNQQNNYFSLKEDKSSRSQSRDTKKSAKTKETINNYNVPQSFRNSTKRNLSPGKQSPVTNSLYQQNDRGSKSFSKTYTSEKQLHQRPQTSNLSDLAKRIQSSRSTSRTPDRSILDRKPSVKQKKLEPEQSKLIKIGGLSSRSKNFSSCQVLNNSKGRQQNLKSNAKEEDPKDQSINSYDTHTPPISVSPNLTDPTPSVTPSRFDDSSQTTATKTIHESQPGNDSAKNNKLNGKNRIQYSQLIQKSQQIKQKSEPKKQLGSLVTQVKKGQIFPPSIKVQVTNQPPQPQPQVYRPKVTPSVTFRQSELQRQSERIYFSPPFPGAKYYQTALVHFHYQQVYHKLSPLTHKFRMEYGSEDTQNYFKEVFEEHFIQTFYSLRYCMTIPPRPFSEIHNKICYLPVNRGSDCKKTIVFDLDETLIHCNDSNDDPCDFMVEIDFPENETIQACINVRPYCTKALEVLKEYFELILFTASHKCYAEAVLQQIDPTGDFFKHRFYRESCIQAGEGLYIKDLRIIGNRNLQDILLIDNASYSFCHQIDNGIPIIPFYDRPEDKELLYLTNYLLDLRKRPDWIGQNRKTFNFEVYKQAQTLDDCLRKLIDMENMF